MPAADAIRHLVELCGPYADGLGLTPHLDDVERMLREGNGAQQQVKAHREGQSLKRSVRRHRGEGPSGLAARAGSSAGGWRMSEGDERGRVLTDEERARA